MDCLQEGGVGVFARRSWRAAVKAATENKNRFKVPEEIRERSAAAAKCRNAVEKCSQEKSEEGKKII